VVASGAARSRRVAAPARRSRAHDRFRPRSAAAPSQCGVWRRRSAAARPPAAAADSGAAATSDPRDKQASGAAPRSPPTNAAATYKQSSARRHAVSPLPCTNNQTRRRRPAHDDQQVRDERYGEAPSGPSFGRESFAEPTASKEARMTTQPSTTCRGTSSREGLASFSGASGVRPEALATPRGQSMPTLLPVVQSLVRGKAANPSSTRWQLDRGTCVRVEHTFP
jgi:hypothetical protein